MSKLSAQGLLPYIYRMSLVGHTSEMSDAQLLERYIQQNDESAFDMLLHRFGPMVYGVCRRILSCPHDADDAFQATFLVLMQKAHTIKPKSNAGNWLYGVAYRIALKARTLSATRTTKEKAAAKSEETSDKSHDLAEVVDHVLDKLPGKYRQVVLMCDLQGKTRKQVARELGCPEGTVAGRLARGRSIMADRLKRQGVCCSASAVFTALAAARANATIPSRVLQRIIQLLGNHAQGITSSRILALTKGVIGMKRNRLFAVVLFTCLAVLGIGLLSGFPNFDTPASAQTVSKEPAVPPLKEKTKRPRNATPKRFEIHVMVKTRKKDGKPITVAMPTIRTVEGREASFLSGGEKAVPAGEGIEWIPFGMKLTANVFRRQTDGKRFVDITAAIVDIAPDTQDETQVRTHSIRTIRPFRDAKQFKLHLDHPSEEGKRYEWRFTISRLRKQWPSLTN